MGIYLNSQNSQFNFSLNDWFVIPTIEEKYSRFLQLIHSPYSRVLDFLNSTIKSISYPGINVESAETTRYYGLKRYYPSAQPTENLYERQVTITFASIYSHISYKILEEIITTWHVIANGNNTLKPGFILYMLDEQGNQLYSITFENIFFNSLSSLELSYSDTLITEKTFTASFMWNFLNPNFQLGDEYFFDNRYV